MFLTLLILTQAVAEWVEISQQHYRKPMHSYSVYNPFTKPEPFEVEVTTKSWRNSNRSVPEPIWHKASMTSDNIGFIKRVNTINGDILPTEDKVLRQADSAEYDVRPHGPIRPTTDRNAVKQKGSIEKISNIGNVKRVQLNDSPVKSPALDKSDSGINTKSRYEEFPLNNEKETNYEISLEKKSNKRNYINNLGYRFSTEPVLPIDRDDLTITDSQIMRRRPNPELDNNVRHAQRHSSIETTIETKNLVQSENNKAVFQLHSKIVQASDNQIKMYTDTSEIHDNETYNNDDNIFKDIINDSFKDRPLSKDPIKNTVDLENLSKITKTDLIPNAKEKVNNVHHEINSSKSKEKMGVSEGSNHDNKMENLVKFLKVVANTIAQNTKKSVNGKLRYLHELKDSILANVAERIDATWPDDDTSSPHRSARSTQASPRGHHVQFPSSESALMTISFLTFAVFLIKLVLQIIQVYKNKTMMVAPVLVSSGGRTTF